MNKTGHTRAATAAWLIATLLGPTAHAVSSSVGGTELEVRELAEVSPKSVALIADADRAARGGAPRQAWNLYGVAWTLAPRSPIPPRGICRLALALGMKTSEQRRAAVEACHQALLLGGTPEDIGNKVSSLIDGDPLPTMEDLVSASVAAEGAVRVGPTQPWGAAARGDLALRLRDRALLDAAVAELRQIAPDHPATRRLMALAAPSPGRWVWAARLAVVFLFIFTFVHALRGRLPRWRRAGPAGPAGLSVLAVVTLLLVVSPAGAVEVPAPEGAASIDDAHPELSVPSPAQQMQDPLGFANVLMELGARADAATTRRDFAAAARYYAALAKAVPERSYALSKECQALEAAGRHAEAIDACGRALSRQGTTAGDFTQFVRLLLAKSAPLTPKERQQAEAAIAALDREPRAALIAARVRCNVATHEHDLAALEACTGKLVAAAPSDPSTLGFEWALALEKNDQAGAEHLASRAVAAGLDPATVARLRRATTGTRAVRVARALRWGLEAGLGFAILALGVVLVARRIERARRGAVLS